MVDQENITKLLKTIFVIALIVVLIIYIFNIEWPLVVFGLGILLFFYFFSDYIQVGSRSNLEFLEREQKQRHDMLKRKYR